MSEGTILLRVCVMLTIQTQPEVFWLRLEFDQTDISCFKIPHISMASGFVCFILFSHVLCFMYVPLCLWPEIQFPFMLHLHKDSRLYTVGIIFISWPLPFLCISSGFNGPDVSTVVVWALESHRKICQCLSAEAELAAWVSEGYFCVWWLPSLSFVPVLKAACTT